MRPYESPSARAREISRLLAFRFAFCNRADSAEQAAALVGGRIVDGFRDDFTLRGEASTQCETLQAIIARRRPGVRRREYEMEGRSTPRAELRAFSGPAAGSSTS
jgi:hypothetical protein